jgi:hypothetical protein
MTPLDTVRARLPWRVRTAEWVDPTLVVGGDGWSMTISCSWRVCTPTGVAYGSSSVDAEDRVWDLVGAEVVGIEAQGVVSYADPRLVLRGGLALELFSEAEPDAFVVRSGDDIVIVGPFPAGTWS